MMCLASFTEFDDCFRNIITDFTEHGLSQLNKLLIITTEKSSYPYNLVFSV